MVKYNKTYPSLFVVIAFRCSFDQFQSGHNFFLFFVFIMGMHGRKKHDEFNGIIYYSLFEDYKVPSDLVNFRTTNSDFYQVLQS